MFRSTVCRSIAVLLATGSLIACGPEPTPTTSPTPSPVASQAPTESAQERQQRLDYEAAEKAYRTFRAEFRRVLREGGAKKATPVMKMTADGKYLEETVEVIQAYKGLGDKQSGDEVIAYVRHGGYSPKSLILETCEDSSKIRAINKAGDTVGRGERRALRIEVRLRAGAWQLWSGTGKKVEACD